jgi:hypothetical protein
MKLVKVGVVALCLFGPSGRAFAQIPLRDGNWEVTVQVQVPGMPMKMPDIKDVRCLTRDQLKDPSLAMPSASPDSNNDCKVSDYKATGTKATWTMACTVPMPISGSGEITYAGDTYSGSMTLATGGGDATMKFTGKRLGDCTAPAAK